MTTYVPCPNCGEPKTREGKVCLDCRRKSGRQPHQPAALLITDEPPNTGDLVEEFSSMADEDFRRAWRAMVLDTARNGLTLGQLARILNAVDERLTTA